MREALAVARRGLEVGEMPIGAVVVVDDEIVAAEHTQELTTGRLLVHADLLALEAADRVIPGCRERSTLYVTLEPCIMCLGAAFTAKLGAVVYGLESPTDGGVASFEHWGMSRDADGMPGDPSQTCGEVYYGRKPPPCSGSTPHRRRREAGLQRGPTTWQTSPAASAAARLHLG